ncbi:MAG TPA: response regulator transcription factor [Bryobacteraceae bacterium]|nr:response regulator transcription factor [Bryobacteraceae bacterium]
MGQIRIVLANHHPIVRTTLRSLLEKEPAFEIVGEAANGREAVVLSDYRRPDVVLLDIHLPIVNGISAAVEISTKSPRPGIIMVTELADEEYVMEAFKAGARGYVRADTAQADLASAVRTVAQGNSYVSPSITSQLSQISQAQLLSH